MDLFSRIEARVGRVNGKVVSARHFTDNTCKCMLCTVTNIEVISETVIPISWNLLEKEIL